MVACSLQCPAAHRHRAIYRILLSPVQRPKKTKKPAQTHCLSGTNTDKQHPWYHPHSGHPALSFADRHCSDLHSTRNTALRLIHGVLVTGTHPRRLLLTEDCLRVRPPSEVHSPLLPPPRFHHSAALCGILSGATPLHLRFE